MNRHLVSTAALVVGAVVCVRTVPTGGREGPRWLDLDRVAQDQASTFRASADMVSVDVAVRRRDRPVTGLQAADFAIRDNGIAQSVASLSFERMPIDVTVAIDVSESVTGALLGQLRQAAHQLRSDLAQSDRMRLVTSNMRVRQVADFDTPPMTITTEMNAIRPFGSSAILDTLAVLLSTPPPPDRRQLIVLFSDGMDTSSVTDMTILLDIARRTTPTVMIVTAGAGPSTISSVPVASTTSMTIDPRFYAKLAADTGGVLVAVRPGDSLSSAFRRVLQEFRSSYVLYFTPAGVERRGVHALDVTVNRTGVEVRARKDYVWK